MAAGDIYAPAIAVGVTVGDYTDFIPAAGTAVLIKAVGSSRIVAAGNTPSVQIGLTDGTHVALLSVASTADTGKDYANLGIVITDVIWLRVYSTHANPADIGVTGIYLK